MVPLTLEAQPAKNGASISGLRAASSGHAPQPHGRYLSALAPFWRLHFLQGASREGPGHSLRLRFEGSLLELGLNGRLRRTTKSRFQRRRPLEAVVSLRRSRPLDRTTTKRNSSEDEIAADAFGPKETKHLEECGVKTSDEDASEEG